jgi:hypothetical protein
MTTPADRLAAEVAASQSAREAEVDNIAYSALAATERRWWDGIAWWRNAHTCYAKGLDDGIRMGREQAYRQIFEGLFESMKTAGNLGDVMFREAMDRMISDVESDSNRRAWDATARRPRPGDFEGRAAA